MRAVLLAFVVLVAFAGCTSSGPKPANADKVVVQIVAHPDGNWSFEPDDVVVAPNQLIEWQNKSNATHRVVVVEFENVGGGTQPIPPDGARSLRLNTNNGAPATTWHVKCSIHPNMTMLVQVIA